MVWWRGTPWSWRTLVEVIHPVGRWTAPPVAWTVHIWTTVRRRIRALTLTLELLMLLMWAWGWGTVGSRRAVVRVSIVHRRRGWWVAAWHWMKVPVATLVEFVRGFVLRKSSEEINTPLGMV